MRTGSGLLNAGAYGINQVASELGLFDQRDRRLARDILGIAQMSFGRLGRVPAISENARQAGYRAHRAARDALKPPIEAKAPVVDPRTKIPVKFPFEISRQKQARHIFGTSEHGRRLGSKQGSSSFFGEKSAERLTLEAYKKGKFEAKGEGQIEHDFGVTTGTSSKGHALSGVKVHLDKKGRIHGHPNASKNARKKTRPGGD